MVDRRVAILALLLPGLLGCGGSGTSAPTAPAPTPAPVVVASPTPKGFACPLPAMPDLHGKCPKETPRLGRYVSDALDRVVREHPEYFDLTDDKGGGSYKVLDREKYHQAVVAAIHDQGVCAIVEKEEVALKTTNDFNEQYNIWTAFGYMRRPPGAYITTCYPAQF
jgi:hypothetical protein